MRTQKRTFLRGAVKANLSAQVGRSPRETYTATSSEPLRTMRGHTCKVLALAVAPTGRAAVSAGEDGVLRVWRLPPCRAGQPTVPRTTESTQAQRREECAVVVGRSDWARDFDGGDDGVDDTAVQHTDAIWDLTFASPSSSSSFPSSSSSSSSSSSPSNVLLSASADGTVGLWVVTQGWDSNSQWGVRRVGAYKYQDDDPRVAPTCLAPVHSDPTTFVAGYNSRTVVQWDIESGSAVCAMSSDPGTEATPRGTCAGFQTNKIASHPTSRLVVGAGE